MPQDFQVVSSPIAPVSAYAWNKDRTQIALSRNNNEVQIMEFKNGNFTLLHTLTEHTQNVTGIDWAAESNRIVTCGQDRNAYVFVLENGAWKPTLVILRINRAATCVKWSPKEDKFALGSGSRLLSICYFDPEYDWWGSKHIKKPIRSTITCVAWHPNNVLIAAGSSDFKARVFSAYVKTVDAKPEATAWGKKMSFGDVMGEFGTSPASGGWVHTVAFSPSGNQLAFAAHDSSVTLVDAAKDMKVNRVESDMLPFRTSLWITPNSFVVAGHDYVPVLFTYDGTKLQCLGKMDVPAKKATKTLSAMDKFKTLDKKGTTDEDSTRTSVDSVHQNAINQLEAYAGAAGAVSKFTTSGVDGKIVIWDIKEIEGSTGLNIA
eukprot:m.178113 g.178113  ORF g.178113 m.178113 type:complete len:376 (+) comp21410_c0_seq4:75-1202(+)